MDLREGFLIDSHLSLVTIDSTTNIRRTLPYHVLATVLSCLWSVLQRFCTGRVLPTSISPAHDCCCDDTAVYHTDCRRLEKYSSIAFTYDTRYLISVYLFCVFLGNQDREPRSFII